jgi:hypothetical protein
MWRNGSHRICSYSHRLHDTASFAAAHWAARNGKTVKYGEVPYNHHMTFKFPIHTGTALWPGLRSVLFGHKEMESFLLPPLLWSDTTVKSLNLAIPSQSPPTAIDP